MSKAKPKAKRGRKALVVKEALIVLARLATDGAHAGVDSGATDLVAIYAPRDGVTERVAEARRSAIAYCLDQGWVAPDPCGSRWQITAVGARAMRAAQDRERRARPAASPAAGQRQSYAAGPQGGENALAWLRNRRDKDGRPLITEVQFNAGEQLAADFWHGQLSPRVTANWSAGASGRRMRRSAPGVGVEVRDAVISARRRFQRALDTVGPELAGILVNVCCEDMGLEAAGQAAGWPQRAARVVLDLALTRLARHYGLIAPERPLGTALRHWGDTDYRPTLDGWG